MTPVEQQEFDDLAESVRQSVEKAFEDSQRICKEMDEAAELHVQQAIAATRGDLPDLGVGG